MKEINFEGKLYRIASGRDVDRGGTYLELSLTSSGVIGALAEVFLYEDSGDIVFKTFQEEVPVELVEFLIGEAKTSLNIKA